MELVVLCFEFYNNKIPFGVLPSHSKPNPTIR